ncbi:MAG: glycosyltransferase family protein [Pseudomonadota bacterium]
MKTYQCIHKYPPHIPAFERRWGIGDGSSFAEIHDALIRDGYASVYRLVPSPGHADDEVFFTVWNYERLQLTWAREHGLQTTDLDDIRRAQIENFGPDVVYDFSSFNAPGFAQELRRSYKGAILCWNGFLQDDDPPVNPAYDGYVSLHRPYVARWRTKGHPALELQPGIDPAWTEIPVPHVSDRPEDLILYGQITPHFKGRADLVKDVAHAASAHGFRFTCHAQATTQYHRPGGRLARYGIELPFLIKWPDRTLRHSLSPPLYGIALYEGIRQAKAVLNNFTDLSVGFHSNMRIFETIGNGTPLVTPKGVYPDGLEDGIDYLSFDSVEDISDHVTWIIAEPEAADAHAKRAKARMAETFSKERQYDLFHDFASGL